MLSSQGHRAAGQSIEAWSCEARAPIGTLALAAGNQAGAVRQKAAEYTED